jgi:hypothetical protein
MASVFRMADKIEGFKKKLEIWEGRIPKKCFDMLPNLGSIVDKDGYLNLRCLTSAIAGHLRSISEHFSVYFPPNDDPRNGNEWGRNPFKNNNTTGMSLTPIQEDKLLELSCDRGIDASIKNETNLSAFWIKIRPEYVEVSDIAVKMLLPLPSACLCEAGCSALTSLKTEQGNRLNVRGSLRVALSNIEPRLDTLCLRKQAVILGKSIRITFLSILYPPDSTGGF